MTPEQILTAKNIAHDLRSLARTATAFAESLDPKGCGRCQGRGVITITDALGSGPSFSAPCGCPKGEEFRAAATKKTSGRDLAAGREE